MQEFRVAASELSKVPWATWDFTTMYESLEHQRLLDGCSEACLEAWAFQGEKVAQRLGLLPSEVDLRLGRNGWLAATEAAKLPEVTWFSQTTLRETLHTILNNLFVFNGGVLKRQVRGIPMGLGCAPQLSNLYGYSVESKWVDTGGMPPFYGDAALRTFSPLGEGGLTRWSGHPGRGCLWHEVQVYF